MKVTLVNHSDSLGGASVVTFRLMNALRDAGVDARMLVLSKTTDSPFVETAPKSRLPFLAEHLEIFVRNGFSRRDLFKASIATVGHSLSEHPLIKDADVVALNWVNQGMLSLKEIGKIASKKPVVWTMHDMWNFTGVCHHAADCDKYLLHCHNCPLLNGCAGKRDLSYSTFERKARLYRDSGIYFVAVSNWLADCARRSVLLGNQKLTTIHNPFPISELSAPATMSRAELGLPENGKIILFCAARIDDPIKGLPEAVEALNKVKSKDAVAVFIGAVRDPHALDALQFPYRHIGLVYDKKRLQAIFAHSSVVLSSSSFETLATTLIEGQAAGVTPVAFTHDGRADIITDCSTGYSASVRPLCEAIDFALKNPILKENLHAAANRFSTQTISAEYISLFKQILSD